MTPRTAPRWTLPGLLTDRLMLVRSSDLVVFVDGLRLWPAGLAFTLHVLTSPALPRFGWNPQPGSDWRARPADRALEAVFPGGEVSRFYGPFDLRRAETTGIALEHTGGRGGQDRTGAGAAADDWWLTPLPPPDGDLLLRFRWDRAATGYASAAIPADRLHRAAARALDPRPPGPGRTAEPGPPADGRPSRWDGR